MGSTKWRQGRSVSIGLLQNKSKPINFTLLGKKRGSDPVTQSHSQNLGFLMAVATALLRPFRAINTKFQQYRRKV